MSRSLHATGGWRGRVLCHSFATDVWPPQRIHLYGRTAVEPHELPSSTFALPRSAPWMRFRYYSNVKRKNDPHRSLGSVPLPLLHPSGAHSSPPHRWYRPLNPASPKTSAVQRLLSRTSTSLQPSPPPIAARTRCWAKNLPSGCSTTTGRRRLTTAIS